MNNMMNNRVVVIACILLCATSCSDNLVCIPGETEACLGPGGCAGAQACNSDGTGYRACDCGGSQVDASNQADALVPGTDGSLTADAGSIPDALIVDDALPGHLVTISDIQHGIVGEGARVYIENVVVVGHKPDDKQLWIADRTVTGPYSGIVAFDSHGTLTVTPGSVIHISGEFQEYLGLTNVILPIFVDTGLKATIPSPNVISSSEISQRPFFSGSDCSTGICDDFYSCAFASDSALYGPYYYCGSDAAEPWESVLVTVQNVWVSSGGAFDTGPGVDRVIVSDMLYGGAMSPYSVCYASITGFVGFHLGAFTIMPRGPSDVIPGDTCF